ncbi:hypothetical protein Tco_0567831 [Tanacetum coccineum]
MVRSMLILLSTVYPFGYALESAVRILNMVSHKKVDMTPYGKIWHGKCAEYVLFKARLPVEPEVWVLHGIIPVRRSDRHKNALQPSCLNMEVEDDEICKWMLKTAFLNGRLDEDIYMELPEGRLEDLEADYHCGCIANILEYMAASEAAMEAIRLMKPGVMKGPDIFCGDITYVRNKSRSGESS